MNFRNVTFDPYRVLGVHRTASGEQLRAAYRNMARQSHPDVGGDAARFSNIAAAYEILADPHLRAQYDSGRMSATEEPSEWGYQTRSRGWDAPASDYAGDCCDCGPCGCHGESIFVERDDRPTLGEYGIAGATWATDKVGVILSRRLWFWLLGVNVAATLIAAAAPLAYRTDYPWLVHVNVVLPISFYGSIALLVIAAAVYVADRVDAAWKRRRRSTSLTTFR